MDGLPKEGVEMPWGPKGQGPPQHKAVFEVTDKGVSHRETGSAIRKCCSAFKLCECGCRYIFCIIYSDQSLVLLTET